VRNRLLSFSLNHCWEARAYADGEVALVVVAIPGVNAAGLYKKLANLTQTLHKQFGDI